MGPGEHGVNWNEQADMYSDFAFCELEDTRTYLDAIGVGEGDTVLDVCCGPGRISVLAAERGATVTGIDSAEKMLEHARANAERAGVAANCMFRLLDWKHVLPGQNLSPADVVIASRCGAMMDVEKLSSLAKRTVGVQIFANAPSIPELQNVLFSGCGEEDGRRRGPEGKPGPSGMDGMPPMGMSGGPGFMGGPGGPGPRPDGPIGGPGGPGPRKAIYLKIAEKAFQAGYDPNVRIFPERFHKAFASAEEAVDWVAALKPERAKGNLNRLALNVAPFLSKTDDGVEFCIATKAAIIWWDVA